MAISYMLSVSRHQSPSLKVVVLVQEKKKHLKVAMVLKPESKSFYEVAIVGSCGAKLSR